MDPGWGTDFGVLLLGAGGQPATLPGDHVEQLDASFALFHRCEWLHPGFWVNAQRQFGAWLSLSSGWLRWLCGCARDWLVDHLAGCRVSCCRDCRCSDPGVDTSAHARAGLASDHGHHRPVHRHRRHLALDLYRTGVSDGSALVAARSHSRNPGHQGVFRIPA